MSLIQEPVPGLSQWRLSSASGPVGTLVLRIAGRLDAEAHGPVDSELSAHLAVSGAADVVLDVTEVTALSQAGADVLVRLAQRLARRGRRLVVVATGEPVRQVVRATADGRRVEVVGSVEAAVAALLRGRADQRPARPEAD